MKHIAFVYATEIESLPLRKSMDWKLHESCWVIERKAIRYSLIHTGIGMANTAFALGQAFAKEAFDLAINLGIAGAIDKKLSLGEVVEITEDCFAEMGAESPSGFLDLEAMGFSLLNHQPLFNSIPNKDTSGLALKKVKGVTVNKVHGMKSSIDRLMLEWPQAQVESMEGAAFFLSCMRAGIPCLQFRSISNYVVPRDRETWDIPLALQALTNFTHTLMDKGFDLGQ